MKPATVGVFAFLLSLLVYTDAGIYLLANDLFFGRFSLWHFLISLIGSIVTGYLAYRFERGPK